MVVPPGVLIPQIVQPQDLVCHLLLAAFEGVKRFRHLLDSMRFRLHFDHKPVVQVLLEKTKSWNSHQAHQLLFLSKFDLELFHLAGSDIVVVDPLSHAPVSLLPVSDPVL